MAGTYTVTASSRSVNARKATLLTLAFGVAAQNDQIVRDAIEAVGACELVGGDLVLLNGPASLPVAIALGHAVAHKFGAVGCFDPKMGGYVISVTHNPAFEVGQLIPSMDVVEG
jgi:CRISPR-associated protein Csx3